ncbi:glycosyltransferase family protein [Microbacterium sp. NPDC077663]|uniref:glycosyltransferase family protein n=1 Tax=Microbacterium sp. NPDC077663 TaxID=3364189 RepID=UPI0037C5B42E
MVIRIALYSHDSVGLGHVRRNLAIAHALSERLPALLGDEVTGLLISGQSAATAFPTPAGWDWLILPSITTGPEGYSSQHLAAGLQRVTGIRGGSVQAAMAAFRPDLFVVDRHAFGVERELEPTLRWLRQHRPSCTTVLGLRDVLDEPAATRGEWAAIGGADAVRRAFDEIWVYGDPRVHDLTRTGEIPAGLVPLVRHTGYLSHGRPGRGHPVADEPFVLTTVGGGSDGGAIAAAAARATVPTGIRHVIVTGPEMPAEDRRAIRAAAGPLTTVTRSVPDALALIRRADAVVSMGGYNAVAEIMSTATPALIVPRDNRRVEQPLRAAALASLGAVETLSSAHATPEALTAFFARTVGTRVARAGIDLDGLATVADHAAELVAAARTRKELMEHAV